MNPLAKRRELLSLAWDGALPRSLPTVTENYAGLSARSSWPTDISRVDLVPCPTLRNGVSNAHLCYPAADPAVSHVVQNRLVLVHGGHSDHYYGLAAFLVYDLVRLGFHVLGMCMPTDGFNAVQDFRTLANSPVTVTSHNFAALEADGASPLRFFVDGSVVALNHCEAAHNFDDVCAVGISGGGWTVDLLASVDSRVSRTYSVFSALPFPLRAARGGPGSDGDWEQLAARSYWSILRDYDVIWRMACAEPGRRRVQFLGPSEPVFPVATVRPQLASYDVAIGADVGGEHRIEFDPDATTHEYTARTRAAILSDIQAAA